MSKYEKYKPSAIAWIGDVPSEWKVNRIKNVVDIFGRIGFRGYTVADIVNDGEGAISLSPSNIIDQKIVLENSTYISFFKYDESPEIQIQNEDVILVKTASVGKAIFVEGLTEKTTINPQLIVFKNYKIHRKFFYYTVISNVIQGQITKDTAGGVIGTVTQQAVNNYKIVIPSKAEQLTIANYLDQQTQKIDRLIANKKAQAEKLKELRQIEINNAVTKGLNPNAEMKDSGIDWLGKIPKNWKTNRLKNVTYINQEVITEKTYPDYELKYIDIGNVTSNGEFLELQEMTFSEAPSRARRKPKHNSIILSTVRTYLRAIAFVQNPDDNLIASTGFAVIDAYENLFDAKYLFYQMTSHIVVERVIANSDGVSYPAISSTKLGDMKIILPPKEEQELISKYLEDRTTAIDKLIKNIDAQIEKLQEVRKIKIYEAVTGKIKVNAYVEATA
jgi:type I restriction enzyme S subunit